MANLPKRWFEGPSDVSQVFLRAIHRLGGVRLWFGVCCGGFLVGGSDLVSLADASVLLGVSTEHVRQLVVAGDLPSVRFGNAWAVPRESVDARRKASNRRGRPLNAARAWESIVDGAMGSSALSNPMADLPVVVLPRLLGGQAESWAALLELAPTFGDN